MQKALMILAAAGMLAASSGLAFARVSSFGTQNSWWDQVEKAQACAMQPGNPFAYSMNSPCGSTPPAAYAEAQRAYPGYYGYPAYGYGYGQFAPPYRYWYGYGY